MKRLRIGEVMSLNLITVLDDLFVRFWFRDFILLSRAKTLPPMLRVINQKTRIPVLSLNDIEIPQNHSWGISELCTVESDDDNYNVQLYVRQSIMREQR